MTTPRGIGVVRPFPFMEATQMLKWPTSLIKWMQEIRYALTGDGQIVREAISLTSTDNTVSTLWEYEMPENSAVITEMSFVGIRSDGANQTIWKVMSGFYRGTGNAVKADMQNLTDSSYSYWYFMGTPAGLYLIPLPDVSGTKAQWIFAGVAGQTWKCKGSIKYSVVRA